MPLHLLKLCVGIDSLEQLRQFTKLRAENSAIHAHVTRMRPSRAEELLDGGSLYWIIKGQLAARQKLVGLEDFIGGDGIKRCALQLDNEIVTVSPRPCRAFQGWRYLKPADAPPDLGAAGAEMPEELRRELGALGLL